MSSKYSIRIDSPKCSYHFEFRVYKLEKQSEYYLDPSSHYFENAGKIPDFLTYMKKSHGIRIVSNPKLVPE